MNMDEVRSILMQQMKELAENKRPPMEFDKRVYYTDKQRKAATEMRPNAGDGLATFASMGKALSIMACTPTSTVRIEQIWIKERAEQETKATRSYNEAIQKLPSDDLESLSKTMSTFALDCLALYGETCDFAKRLQEIYYLLEEDDIKND